MEAAVVARVQSQVREMLDAQQIEDHVAVAVDAARASLAGDAPAASRDPKVRKATRNVLREWSITNSMSGASCSSEGWGADPWSEYDPWAASPHSWAACPPPWYHAWGDSWWDSPAAWEGVSAAGAAPSDDWGQHALMDWGQYAADDRTLWDVAEEASEEWSSDWTSDEDEDMDWQ